MFPDIPLASAFEYVGSFFLIAGFFLIITGLGILKVEKVTITKGAKTWGFGIFLVLLGAFFLFGKTGNTQNALETVSETPTLIPSPNPTDTPISTQTNVPPKVVGDTIAITEVMGNPCGTSETEDAIWNEYVELYNYGDSSVDIAGWWITDGEPDKGNPDMLVSWDIRNPTVTFGDQLVFNTTIIPPKSFAVILSSIYYPGKNDYKMPYIFPSNTIILTVADGTVIGDDTLGIEVAVAKNPIILYTGTSSSISKVISSYGSPQLSGSPQDIVDDGKDGIPFALKQCESAERIDLSGPDVDFNWRTVKYGSPGK